MQRISVDLPEPEGPQSTIFSPLRIESVTACSAWKLPYHFSTASIRISGCSVESEDLVKPIGLPITAYFSVTRRPPPPPPRTARRPAPLRRYRRRKYQAPLRCGCCPGPSAEP